MFILLLKRFFQVPHDFKAEMQDDGTKLRHSLLVCEENNVINQVYEVCIGRGQVILRTFKDCYFFLSYRC